MKKLPLSIQTFEEIIKKDMLYVDKTAYVYEMISGGKYYFLSRPRRFGKSLLLTTLKAYFQGKKLLFKGLFIADKEEVWDSYPIIHIDYSRISYKNGVEEFTRTFIDHLEFIAADYDIAINKQDLSSAFNELVLKLHQKYEQQVVILVDEYDKPLVDTLLQQERFEENREVLRGLYGMMKGLDHYLRFVLLTGVSRFAKVGVFSGMNNLQDISLNETYGAVTGFTQEELEANFKGYIEQLATKFATSRATLLENMQIWYNGFCFDGVNKLYNPFSILNLFTDQIFKNYWFSTGTPSFLIHLIKEQKHLPENFEQLKVINLTGGSVAFKKIPLIPLLYQTGYLTIERTGLDDFQPYYYLNYPNKEVRQSFLTHITAAFLDKDEAEIQPEGLELRNALMAEDIKVFVQKLQSFFADIPSRLHIPREAYYHSLTYLILRVVGAQALLEKETDKGRIDAVLEFSDKIYIIEFKFATNKRLKNVETLSKRALQQIKDRKYYEAYLHKNKRILLLGLGYLNKKVHGRVEEIV